MADLGRASWLTVSYLSSALGSAVALRKALDSEDWAEVRTQAHYLKQQALMLVDLTERVVNISQGRSPKKEDETCQRGGNS
jgi:hypothetical protein